MMHHKPVIHEGLEGYTNFRLPNWLRDALDEIAAGVPQYPLAIEVEGTGGVVREFVAAGFLQDTFGKLDQVSVSTLTVGELASMKSADSIFGGGSTPVDLGDDLDADEPVVERGEPIHSNLNAQLTVRFPPWMESHIEDLTGDQSYNVGETKGETIRELVTAGYALYQIDQSPLGQPVGSREKIRCPSCDSVDDLLYWERTYEYWPDLEDLWDELQNYEPSNPWSDHLLAHWRDYGWDCEYEEAGDHPNVENPVTIIACFGCGHVGDKADYIRQWYESRGHKRPVPEP